MIKKEMIAMLLAGGQGSRLGVLTQKVAKPAVSFGGKYRIIDFPLSNCINSGVDTVGVLTQYQPLRLNSHIGIGIPWDLDRNVGGVTILPPYERSKGSDWYTGTANAIYQNLEYMEAYNPEYVLILSGDHIYKMDYDDMLQSHKDNNASLTVAVLDVPLKERKYLWFTSSGLERGTSSGSPAGMFGKIKDGTVYVTEGILKAEIAWMCTGNPYIGVPGVSNHKGLETVLRKLKEQGLKRVYECYDMDKMMELSCKHDEKSACRQCEHGIYLYHGECPKKRRKRDMIRKGCIKLYEICEELNVSCKRLTWDTDASGTWMEHYKGVDDWILRKEEKGHRKTA